MIVDKRYVGQWRALSQVKRAFCRVNLSRSTERNTAQALLYADASLIRVEEACGEMSSLKPTMCFIALESLNTSHSGH